LLALIQEMGWHALIVPEENGGVGYGLAELCGLLQEHGFAAMPPLFFANHVAPVLCLSVLPECEKKTELMGGIAEGLCIPCMSANSSTVQAFSESNPVQAEAVDGGYALSGSVSNLVSAGFANTFFVPARIQDHTLFVAVDTADPSLKLTSHYDKSFGQTHELVLNHTFAGKQSVICEDAGYALSQAYLLCAIAKSAELIGGAERAMRFAVEHISSRKQFGKLLAEFQAVQHQAADMFKSIEVAKLFLREVVVLVDGEQPFEMAAHNCKAWSNEANFLASKTSHQLMGGTGYMMETDLHLLTLHGLRNGYEFGSTDHHKNLIAGLLGL
jgi:alkylation response protein AidB-like acyl-CoA dehydrogenase